MASNKIKYNLKNCAIASCTETLSDAGEYSYTYGTPAKVPGAVSLSMEPQGEQEPFYADGVEYYKSNANNGYEGDVEFALIPDEIKIAYLNEKKDSNGVIYEVADGADAPMFAFLFEFDGDQKAIRHVMYCCTMARPTVSGKTKENTITPETESVTITAIPRKDNYVVKGRTSADTDATKYSNWYNTVYEPVISE